jgi:hypothetical protein
MVGPGKYLLTKVNKFLMITATKKRTRSESE